MFLAAHVVAGEVLDEVDEREKADNSIELITRNLQLPKEILNLQIILSKRHMKLQVKHQNLRKLLPVDIPRVAIDSQREVHLHVQENRVHNLLDVGRLQQFRLGVKRVPRDYFRQDLHNREVFLIEELPLVYVFEAADDEVGDVVAVEALVGDPS